MESYQLLFKKIEVIKEIENLFDEECYDHDKYVEKELKNSKIKYDDLKKSLVSVKHNEKLDKLRNKYRDAVNDAYDLFKDIIPMILIDKVNYDNDINEVNSKYCYYTYRNRHTRNPIDSSLILSALSHDVKCDEN